jgi:hypothetical protein
MAKSNDLCLVIHRNRIHHFRLHVLQNPPFCSSTHYLLKTARKLYIQQSPNPTIYLNSNPSIMRPLYTNISSHATTSYQLLIFGDNPISLPLFCVPTCLNSDLTNTKRNLKGTVLRDRFRKCWRILIDLGLNKGRGWVLNFSEAPLIFNWNKTSSFR